MHKKLLFVVVALSLLLTACTDSDVSTVKQGTMGGYKTTTVGNAFDGSFDSPKWTAFKGEKGERVVEFNGLISQRTHDSVKADVLKSIEDIRNQSGNDSLAQTYYVQMTTHLVGEAGYQTLYEAFAQEGEATLDTYKTIFMQAFDEKGWPVGTAATAQWIVSPDGKEFQLTHLSSPAWVNVKYDDILKVLYR